MNARRRRVAGIALAVFAGACSEPVADAPGGEECPPPDVPEWRVPARSALDDALELAVPTDASPPADPARERWVAELLDAWDPAAVDPRSVQRRMQLERFASTALAVLEGQVRDGAVADAARHASYDRLLALRVEGVADVLERLLDDAVPEDLRARAAWDLGRLGGEHVLDTLLFEFRVYRQDGRFHPDLYYERDEYVTLFLAAALVRRGNLGPLPYLTDLDRRVPQGEVTTRYDRSALAPIVRRTWVAVLREHDAGALAPAGEEPTHEQLAARSRSLHAFWLAHGVAPRDAHAPPVPAPLEGRLAQRLLARMRLFRETPLRPVDEARHLLSALGVRALSVLRVGLRDRDLFVREYTLDAVARLGAPAAPLAEDVVALLGDPATRTRALQALGAIGAPSSLERWQGLALSDDAELRTLATLALGRIGAPQALPCLLRAHERLPVTADPEGALARAFALCRLDRLEGVRAWSALRPLRERLDPIRWDDLRAATLEHLRARPRTAPHVAATEGGSEPFWDALAAIEAALGAQGSFAASAPEER